MKMSFCRKKITLTEDIKLHRTIITSVRIHNFTVVSAPIFGLNIIKCQIQCLLFASILKRVTKISHFFYKICYFSPKFFIFSLKTSIAHNKKNSPAALIKVGGSCFFNIFGKNRNIRVLLNVFVSQNYHF
jgi:hypothetical protein